MRDLHNKQVVITGGNRGIGLGLAEGFAVAGASVTIAGLEDDTPDVAAGLDRSPGARHQGLVADITRNSDIRKLAGSVGQVDVLVNNAGLERSTPITGQSDAVATTFRRIVDTNITGTFEITRALLPKIPDGGRIINTSSIWGKTAVAQYSAYCASKHAIIGLTRSLARELGDRRITVNAVCPGWVRTESSMQSLSQMASSAELDESELLGEIVAAQALDGLMEPSDMVGMYLFLASEAAANITGQAFTVDRGELLR